MKIIAALAIIGLAACSNQPAHAQHVNTLEPTGGFGLLKQFHNINNSDDLVGLTIVMSNGAQLYQAGDPTVIDWSCQAAVPTSSSDDTDTLPGIVIHRSVFDYSSAQCTDGIARTLAVGVYSIVKVGSCSGRGCNPRKTYYYLFDGSITTE